jgi:hypothetical protein
MQFMDGSKKEAMIKELAEVTVPTKLIVKRRIGYEKQATQKKVQTQTQMDVGE